MEGGRPRTPFRPFASARLRRTPPGRSAPWDFSSKSQFCRNNFGSRAILRKTCARRMCMLNARHQQPAARSFWVIWGRGRFGSFQPIRLRLPRGNSGTGSFCVISAHPPVPRSPHPPGPRGLYLAPPRIRPRPPASLPAPPPLRAPASRLHLRPAPLRELCASSPGEAPPRSRGCHNVRVRYEHIEGNA